MPLDYPDQSYYPAWKVRLTVRLEEFGQGVLKQRLPPKEVKALNGVLDGGEVPLKVVPDPDNAGRYLLLPKDASPGDQLVPDTSSDGLTHVISGVIPRHFEWKQNGFRTADELTAQIKFSDFPIDPRVIRACAIQFFLGTLTPQEYAQGMRGATRRSTFGSGSADPLNVIPETYLDSNGNQRSNLRFQGWVDKFKLAWSAEEPYVELQCTDNTRLLLNQLCPPKLVLGMKDPIDKSIATYLANFPQFAGLTVEYVGDAGVEVPKLEGALAGTAFRPELGPQPAKGGGGGEELTVWDYLTDVTGAIGHVIRIDGNAVIIQRAATLLHGSAKPRADDPYRTRQLPSGEFPVRTFIYGRNLESFEVTRDFAGQAAKNVEVRCYSPRRKQVMVARFPTKDARIPAAHPGDGKSQNNWTIVRVSGVEDPRVLQQIAEDVFHGRNRNEIEVVMKTKNLASFGGGNEDPDLLDLKSGDSVEVLVDRANPGTIAKAEADLSTSGANERMLLDLGYNPEFARAYAKAFQDAAFQRIYRMREMTVSGDVAEGISFELRSANFVQARADIPPTGAPAAPSGSSTATAGGGKNQTTGGDQKSNGSTKVKK